MKNIPTFGNDAEDDIFGPPRSYSSSYYNTSRQRPSMISAKYRQKEERRKVLKISVNKLRKIEDPEASLCRSVLINNTLKRLQKEAKDEKNGITSAASPTVVKTQQQQKQEPDFALDTDDLVPSDLMNIEYGSRKRAAAITSSESEVEDCDVQDVLSQFYMPPTPRMLTSIDDDDEDIAIPDVKRARLDDNNLTNNSTSNLTNSNLSVSNVTVPVTTASSFSCGHASIFSDLQNNVFHSLVASLET